MADTTETQDAAIENAAGPQEVEIDGQRVKQHSLKDQIALDKHNRQVAASVANNLPFQVRRIENPGAE